VVALAERRNGLLGNRDRECGIHAESSLYRERRIMTWPQMNTDAHR
jgi:hypothetical protein